jgi:hypothetical protein
MKNSVLYIFLILAFSTFAQAQTTEFTYQGRLNDGSLGANGSYDFQFELYDAALSGNLLGTQSAAAVTVTNGIFTIRLNFGEQFNGTERFLAIRVRNAGGPSYTLLNPRQPISSAPYSIRSLTSGTALNTAHADLAADSDRLGGITADQFVVTTDARMTDARTPLPGSPNYVRTGGIPQVADFNITGEGIANVFDAVNEFRISGSTVLRSQGLLNIFVGEGAGSNNLGTNNSLVGANAGNGNTSGNFNSFFGANSGFSNTAGANNSFFGNGAGQANVSGNFNSFFGNRAGNANTGISNSFFGHNAGLSNLGGASNAFFGTAAGQQNTTGSNNTFYGTAAGFDNAGGSNNTAIGFLANVGSGLTYATAIGSGSSVTTANTIALGRSNGSDLVRIPGALTVLGTLTANLPPGDSSYIQNSPALGAQPGYISITGFVDASSFMINNRTVLNTGISNSLQNLFVGPDAGASTSNGFGNTFVGHFAGNVNVSGNNNSFFGTDAGRTNTAAGNSFFGRSSGYANTTGAGNTFTGRDSGRFNTAGYDNTFVGKNAGQTNIGGNNNTAVGSDADVSSSGLAFATAIGSGSVSNLSNTITLGRSNDDTYISGNAFVRVTSAFGFETCWTGSTYGVHRLIHCNPPAISMLNKTPISSGLDVIRSITPIQYNTTENSAMHYAMLADVSQFTDSPLLTKSDTELTPVVNNRQLMPVMVKAMQQQQEKIELLEKQIQALTKIVCTQKPVAEICKP